MCSPENGDLTAPAVLCNGKVELHSLPLTIPSTIHSVVPGFYWRYLILYPDLSKPVFDWLSVEQAFISYLVAHST